MAAAARNDPSPVLCVFFEGFSLERIDFVSDEASHYHLFLSDGRVRHMDFLFLLCFGELGISLVRPVNEHDALVSQTSIGMHVVSGLEPVTSGTQRLRVFFAFSFGPMFHSALKQREVVVRAVIVRTAYALPKLD